MHRGIVKPQWVFRHKKWHSTDRPLLRLQIAQKDLKLAKEARNVTWWEKRKKNGQNEKKCQSTEIITGN